MVRKVFCGCYMVAMVARQTMAKKARKRLSLAILHGSV